MPSERCWNGAGTAFIMVACLLHVVSFLSPKYGHAEFATDRGTVTLDWGMWQICLDTRVGDTHTSTCKLWFVGSFDGHHSLNPGLWLSLALRISLGGALVLIKTVIGVVLTRVAEVRGDRRKEIPYIICIFCLIGGIAVFVSNMIVAGNYSTSIQTLSLKRESDTDTYPFLGHHRSIRGVHGNFSLGWSFSLDLVVVVMAFLSGICHLLGRRVRARHMGSLDSSVKFSKLVEMEGGTFVGKS